MNRIFISYRRDDAEGQAGRLYDDLIAEFGPNSVFIDVSTIEPGQDFRKAIDQSLSSCGAFLAVIGKNWLTAKDASGQRRVDDPTDFVRLETAGALKRDIPVIPVLVQGASVLRPEQLPEELKDLAYRNALELTHPRWESDVQLLIKALRPYMEAARQPAQLQKSETKQTEANQARRNRGTRRRVYTLVGALLAAVGLLLYLIYLHPIDKNPPTKANVPDLSRSTLESAQALLNREHLTLGKTHRRQDAHAPAETIVAQSILPYTQVPAGTAIDVTVAIAPKTAELGRVFDKDGNWVELLSVSPPSGTHFTVGQAVVFDFRVKYLLASRDESNLLFSLTQYDNGNGCSGPGHIPTGSGAGPVHGMGEASVSLAWTVGKGSKRNPPPRFFVALAPYFLTVDAQKTTLFEARLDPFPNSCWEVSE
jgi:hypothetical protein